MGEIYDFSNKTLWELEDLMERLSDEYDDLEDQLLDLEDFAPDKDDKKEYALWQEEYTTLEKRMAEIEKMVSPLRVQQMEVKEALKKQSTIAYKQSNYISNMSTYPMYREASTKYYKSGQEMFADMLVDLKSAKEFIFLEFFIMQPGIMFDSIIDILEEKVKEGVQIRLIYDDFGCLKTLPTKYYKVLQAKGIHCACFNPFRPFLSIIMNNRDHRKILVIDGKIAYTGGVNLADEYINKVERFGYWKDAGVRITGKAVWSFTTMFLEMWNFITKSSEDFTRFMTSSEEKKI